MSGKEKIVCGHSKSATRLRSIREPDKKSGLIELICSMSRALDEKTRKVLLDLYGEEGLPRNAYYGDGEPIEEEALVNIREAFKAEGVVFQWMPQDLLLLDNMLISHSRNPYKGERKILVSMANPYSTTAKVRSATA